MSGALTVHHLRYTIRATESLALEQHPGSALRGALFRALLQRFCALPHQTECATCPLAQACPVAALVAPMRDEQPRGRDVPRPFIIRPPLVAAWGEDGMRLEAGQRTHFTLTLVGSAARLFPYVIMSTAVLQGGGLGRPLRANGGRRGRFTVEQIVAEHPFTGHEAVLYQTGCQQVRVPELAVTEADVRDRAVRLAGNDLSLRFLTPTRLISNGKLAHAPDPAVFVARLAERLDALEREYAPVLIGALADAGSGRWRTVAEQSKLHMGAHATTWVDTQSYSARQQRRTPTGGFIGTAHLAGDLPLDLAELLVWGELLHVGKDVVKGNGWYQIEG
jgi:hypothetical protein